MAKQIEVSGVRMSCVEETFTSRSGPSPTISEPGDPQIVKSGRAFAATARKGNPRLRFSKSDKDKDWGKQPPQRQLSEPDEPEQHQPDGQRRQPHNSKLTKALHLTRCFRETRIAPAHIFNHRRRLMFL